MNNINIGILGGSFCCPNLGVGALTITQCMLLEQIASALSCNIDVVVYEAQIKGSYLDKNLFSHLTIVLDEHTYNPWLMKQKISRHDIVIDLYGGDSFSDIYSKKGFAIGVSQRTFSLRNDQKYIMAPQTIGPFDAWFSRMIAGKLMNRADRIFLRDNDSIELVPEKERNKAVSVTDMAFLLPFEKHQADHPCVGINISGLLWNDTILKDQRKNYRETIYALFRYFFTKKVRIVLVPHVLDLPNTVDGDFSISKKLAEEADGPIDVSPAFENPIEAKSYISQFSMFIGSRMHATIAAASSGVPTLPLAYSKKFSGVFNGLSYPYTIEKNSINPENVLNRVDKMFNNLDEIEKETAVLSDQARTKLDRYYRILLEEVGNKRNAFHC